MDKKKCGQCQQTKSPDQFYKKLAGRQSWCKQCTKSCQAARWTARKIKAVELFGGKCEICGYDKNYAALEFHHKNPAEKDKHWIWWKRWMWSKVIQELKKCVCLCKNCHSELHNPEREKHKNIGQTLAANKWLDKEIISTGKCPECGLEVFGTKYCSVECSRYGSRKVSNRPGKETLRELMSNNNMCAIGRMFNVSDNAVRKWAKQYGILPV